MAGEMDIKELEDRTYKAQILRKGRMGFSGCDVTAMIRLPAYKSGSKTFNKEKVFQIGTLQTISISTYNAKSPVKAIGFKNPISVARGGRTIAGTLIFNQLHHHVFDENTWPSLTLVNDEGLLTYSAGSVDYFLNKELNKEIVDTGAYIDREKLKKQWDFSWDTSLMGERIKPSDMPPFDIVILMVNELGQVGKVVLYGVDIVHDSQTLSVEDIYTEVQYQYVARDIEYFHAVDFEEASSWKSVTPNYKEVQPQEVTGRDKLDMSPFPKEPSIFDYGMSFAEQGPDYTDDPNFGVKKVNLNTGMAGGPRPGFNPSFLSGITLPSLPTDAIEMQLAIWGGNASAEWERMKQNAFYLKEAWGAPYGLNEDPFLNQIKTAATQRYETEAAKLNAATTAVPVTSNQAPPTTSRNNEKDRLFEIQEMMRRGIQPPPANAYNIIGIGNFRVPR